MGQQETQQRIVASAKTADFRPYDRYGKRIAGLSWMPLRYDAPTGTGSYLIRFAPGAASLPHEHGGVEEFVVLEGVLVDADGRRLAGGRERIEPVIGNGNAVLFRFPSPSAGAVSALGSSRSPETESGHDSPPPVPPGRRRRRSHSRFLRATARVGAIELVGRCL